MTEARKDDGGKPQFHRLSLPFLEELAHVLQQGAEVYGEENHLKPMPGWRIRFFNAALRHLFAWFWTQKNDPKTGRSHLAHAAANLMFLFDRNNLDPD